MKRISLFSFLLVVAIGARVFFQACCAQPPTAEMLWSNPMAVNDVAVSRDGRYLAAVNDTGLYFFDSNSSVPVWWWEIETGDSVMSVVISSDGEYVAVGTYHYGEGYIVYFGGSKARVGLQLSPTWQSAIFGDEIVRGTLDMSDNGDYIAVGGSGDHLYYFAGCRTRSGSGQTSTWNNLISGFIYSVDLSSDGRYVALGGMKQPSGGFVAFYKDAYSFPYPTQSLWFSDDVWDVTLDVALSDDGFAVAAATISSSLHYWNDAANLSGNPPDDWNWGVPLLHADMSSDGDEIAASYGGLGSLYFWANGRERTDGTANWTRLDDESVLETAINEDGSIIAAVTEGATGYWTYFYTSEGDIISGPFQLLERSDTLSMSGDGGVVAVGGAPRNPQCLYVFRVTRQAAPTVPNHPVGGEILPVNIVTLLTPYIAYMAVIVVAGLGLAGRRKLQT